MSRPKNFEGYGTRSLKNGDFLTQLCDSPHFGHFGSGPQLIDLLNRLADPGTIGVRRKLRVVVAIGALNELSTVGDVRRSDSEFIDEHLALLTPGGGLPAPKGPKMCNATKLLNLTRFSGPYIAC